MSGIEELASTLRAEGAGGDRLVHLVCLCAPDRALCGKDMTDREWLPTLPHPDDCRVCEDMARKPCRECERGHAT